MALTSAPSDQFIPTRGRLWLRLALASAIGLSAVLAGCRLFEKAEAPTAEERSRAMIAAARANRISLFGDVGSVREGRYHTRTEVSLRRHTFAELGDDFDAALDSQGRRMVFSSTRHRHKPDLYIKSVDGVAVTQLTSDPDSDIQPAISPDDTRVAFASDRSGNWDLWIVPTDGGPPVQVTRSPGDEVHPSWSPDGTKLVFCSLPRGDGAWELWITDARAGGTSRFIGYGLFPEWAPASDTILFQRARERGSRLFGIWTVTLVDGEPRYPTELALSPHAAMTQPTWSADGTRVAFASVAVEDAMHATTPAGDDLSDIWVMGIDGREKIRLTDGRSANHAPVFSGDGRVFFTTMRSGRENVWSVVLVGGDGDTADDDLLADGMDDEPASKTANEAASARRTAVRQGS